MEKGIRKDLFRFVWRYYAKSVILDFLLIILLVTAFVFYIIPVVAVDALAISFSESFLLWFYSTVAQSISALLAFFGVFLIYRLQFMDFFLQSKEASIKDFDEVMEDRTRTTFLFLTSLTEFFTVVFLSLIMLLLTQLTPSTEFHMTSVLILLTLVVIAFFRMVVTAIKLTSHFETSHFEPAQVGEVAVESLIIALKDESSDVRRSVALALGRLGDERVVGPLVESLGDRDKWVRVSVVEALGRIGDRRAIEPLMKALKDESSDVRKTAAEVLEKIKKR